MDIFNVRRRRLASLADCLDALTNFWPCNVCEDEESCCVTDGWEELRNCCQIPCPCCCATPEAWYKILPPLSHQACCCFVLSMTWGGAVGFANGAAGFANIHTWQGAALGAVGAAISCCCLGGHYAEFEGT